VVKGLDPGQVYSFRVVAVDGEYQTPSRVQSVNTYLNIAAGHQPQQSTLASSGWFIGMLLAIVFLLGVCLVVCLVKRNRGGKYAVQEQEATHGRPDYDDQGGFSEYTQPLDGHHRQPSLTSELKLPPESDNESIADYADGMGDGRFDEDGSWIGQYGTLRRKQQQRISTESGLPPGATYV